MRKVFWSLIGLLLVATVTVAEVTVHRAAYEGQLKDNEARFSVLLDLEASGQGAQSIDLFEGELALLGTKMPHGVSLTRDGNRFGVRLDKAGSQQLKLEFLAKITRREPWNQVQFTGPAAVIAEVSVQTVGTGMELQMLKGTVLESAVKEGQTKVRGFLGHERVVALRWQSKTTEVARKALLTCETAVQVQATPTVLKYQTQLKYEIVQGQLSRLLVRLPQNQALTKLQGDGVRDWALQTDGTNQTLTVELVRSLERQYELVLFTEQAVENAGAGVPIAPPQPLEVERETGALGLAAEDVLVETESVSGLRQVNAAAGAVAAYQFYARPFALGLKLRRIEPVIQASDRVGVRVEESRLQVTHRLGLTVEKAGIYLLELVPQTGFVVSEIKGDGVEDWKNQGGKLLVHFNRRVLGPYRLEVQLEQARKTAATNTESFVIGPLTVAAATQQTALIGASAGAGLQLKTAPEGLVGLRELPINRLPEHSDELLAFQAEQNRWELTLSAERLAARVVAEIFNLITIGDGIVGGSASIRYAIMNQGVQEFQVKLPAHWRNVEFTGPNIRRKEQAGDTWTITLQEKAWGGYTLVVTYDFQFPPEGGTLPLGGIHAVGVERETGSIAATSAANLQIQEGRKEAVARSTTAEAGVPASAVQGASLRRVDETELAANDRDLISRPVLLAYTYTGDAYDLTAEIVRFKELPILEAVADRTQLTTVLTDSGELLTQASFMVKNNDKQFLGFSLPAGADFWSCFVRGEPAKPERSGNQLLVPLPRGLNRNEAIAIDIVYAQRIKELKSAWNPIALAAPVSDVQTTYAEWELFVPRTQRLASFGGNMIVARGTTHGLRDAWREFIRFYDRFLAEYFGQLMLAAVVLGLALLIITAVRRGWRWVGSAFAVLLVGAILSAMLLPALSKARGRARIASSMSNLKQIGLGIAQYYEDNNNTMPSSFEQLRKYIGSDKVFENPSTGGRYVYVGPQATWQASPTRPLAYGETGDGGANVLYTDGHVEYTRDFGSLLSRAHDDSAERGPSVPVVVRSPGSAGSGSRSELRTLRGTTEPATPGMVVKDFQWDVQAANMLANVGGALPLVAGLRPIRIDLPRTGTRFVFTKVLNVRGDSLTLSALAIDDKWYRALRGMAQAAAFGLGLGLLGWQAWRRRWNALRAALGVSLVIGGLSAFLLSYRMLDEALILAVPVIGVALFWKLLRAFWRFTAPSSDSDQTPPTPPMGPPPVPTSEQPAPHGYRNPRLDAPSTTATGLVLALLLGASAQAVEPKPAASPMLNRPKPAQAVEACPAVVPSVTIVSAQYTGAVRESAANTLGLAQTAQFEAVFELKAAGTNQSVRLFGDEVAVQEFSGPAAQTRGGWFSRKTVSAARLVRTPGAVSVVLAEPGPATVRVKFLVKLGGDMAKRQLEFGIPAALMTKLAVTVDEPEAVVEVPTAVSYQTAADGQRTRIEAVLGAADRVELSWTARTKRAAEIAATVFCQNTAQVALGGGVLNVRTVLDYNVTQGELRQLKIQLPAHQRLMRVEGETLRHWKLEDQGRTLVVELVKGVSPAYRLTVETERPLEADGKAELIEIPHALGVRRETGLVALRASDEVSLSVGKTSDLQKVDLEEFSRALGLRKPVVGLGSAYRFLKPGFGLSVQVAPVQPQIEAVVRNAVRLGTEQLWLSAQVDYTVKRTGVFVLPLALPAGYRVERVEGQNIAQWVEKQEGQNRVLEVTLKQRTIGAYSLQVALVQNLAKLPPQLSVVGVQPLGAEKVSGSVSVAAEDGLQVKPLNSAGLSEVPATAVGLSAGSGVLAYKVLPTENTIAAGGWQLSISTEKIDSWVRAEVVNWVSLSETLVSGRSLVRFEIQNAPTRQFRLKTPAAWRNVEISGAQIRRRDQVGNEWQIELQNKVRGTYSLVVTWDRPWNAKEGQLELSGLEVPGVERETGWLAVNTPAALRVSLGEATADLLRADARELPDWAGRGGAEPALTHRYLRPGYKLGLAVQRFEQAEVLQALVDSLNLTTVVSEDGQMMTEIKLAIRNNGRQYLELSLPPQATNVWSAFVAGQPVRPTVRNGKLLLPMQRSGADGAPVPVELTYVGTDRFPKRSGRVQLATPALDIPLKNARWELYLPPEFDYADFEGTMKRDLVQAPEAVSARASALFSLAEYAEAEGYHKAKRDSEAASTITAARSNIVGGNINDAVQSLGNLKQNWQGDGTEVKKLEKEINRSRGQKIIAQQRQYSQSNALVGQRADTPNVQALPLELDEAVAEKQAEKVQKSQEIVTVQALPLRVNLPKRGQRLVFTQTLQTETHKPLTVEFSARSAQTAGWPAMILGAAASFLLLWALLGCWLRRRG